MKRYRKFLESSGASFSTVAVGQSFTMDGAVWLRIAPSNGYNAVRISAQAESGQARFASLNANATVYNVNQYCLVHESRLTNI